MSSDKGKEPMVQGPSGRPDDAPRMRASPQGQGTRRHRDMRSLSLSPSLSQPAEQHSNPSSSQPAGQHPNPFWSQLAEQLSSLSAGGQTNLSASRSINKSTAESAKQVSQYMGIPVAESVKPTETKDLPASARPTATMGSAASTRVTRDESPDRTDEDPFRDPPGTRGDSASSDGKPVITAAAHARKQKKRGGKKSKKAKAKKAALAATMGSEDASESNAMVSGNPKLDSDAENASNATIPNIDPTVSAVEVAPGATMPCLTSSDVASSSIKEDTTGHSDLRREIVVAEILKSTLELFDEISKGQPASNMTNDQRQEFEGFAGLLFDTVERDTSDGMPNEHHRQMMTHFAHAMHDKISNETAAPVPNEEEYNRLVSRVVDDLEQNCTPRELSAMLVELQTRNDRLQAKNEDLQEENDEIMEGVNKKTSELAKVARDQRIKIDKLLKDLQNERRVKGTLNKIANENTKLTCRNSELESQMHVLKETLAGALHEKDALRVKLGIQPEALKDDIKNVNKAISNMLMNQVHPNSAGITKTMEEMENNLANLRSAVKPVEDTSTAPPADHN